MTEELAIWDKVYRCINEAEKQLKKASTEEQFQAIGLLCRETLISLAQAVFNPTLHTKSDGIIPSKTDAKRMLEAYLATELAGGQNEVKRNHAKATLALAIELQHKRDANHMDTASCLEATTAVVNLIARTSGRATRTAIPDIQVDFSYQPIKISSAEHAYQLEVAVTNHDKQTMSNFKLEFTFPDLAAIHSVWISPSRQYNPSSQMVEIEPKGKEASFFKKGTLFYITYQSSNPLFPEEKLNLGHNISLRYRINDNIFYGLEDVPTLKWTLYADNMTPKRGEVSLSSLNKF